MSILTYILKTANNLYLYEANGDIKVIYNDPLLKYINAPWPRSGGKGKMQSGSCTKVAACELQTIKHIPKGVTVTLIDFRKCSVTMFTKLYSGNKNSMGNKLAKSMTHKKRTADTCYLRVKRTEQDVEVQNAMEYHLDQPIDIEDQFSVVDTDGMDDELLLSL